jgi:hypothetical protein
MDWRAWTRWVDPRLKGLGVRYSDQEWKRQLNRTIQETQPAINKLLLY